MRKIKHTFFIILLMLLFTNCDDKVKALEYRVIDLEEELREVNSQLINIRDDINFTTSFEKKMQCQEMLDRLKKRWDNVVGCYYSSNYNTCMVKYKMDGKIKEARIEDMADSE